MGTRYCFTISEARKDRPVSCIPGGFRLKKASEKYFKKFLKKVLTFSWTRAIIIKHRALGGIAQLGERLNGIQEVSGSIPLISTKEDLISKEIGSFFT